MAGFRPLIRQRLSAAAVRYGIAVLSLLVACWLEWQPPDMIVRVNESLRDGMLRTLIDRTPEERLVIVDIDEASLREIGPWPWSRGQVADLLETLFGEYGARAVGVDIIFPEAGDRAGDARLSALARHAPLTLAQIFDYERRLPPLQQGALNGGLAPGAAPAIPAYGYMANHGGLADARCVGNIGYTPDRDGVLRRTPALTRFQERDYPHFAASLAACAGIPLPTGLSDPEGWWRVPFSRDLQSYRVLPAADIVHGRIAPQLVSGRFVLVGSSSLGLGDRVSTPLAPLNAGVMVHAESLSALLDRSEGRGAAPWSGRGWLVAWLVFSLGLAVLCIPRLSVWANLALLIGLAGTYLGLALWAVGSGAEWSVSAPLWGYLFLLVTLVPHEWWVAQGQTQRLIDTFSHYVAKPVLDEILRRGLDYSLKPTLREVTVLIADMEGYTKTTSSLSLETAAQLTKDFLDCLTRPVLDHGGTLDKYSGDGLVAFWGAPIPCADQGDRAVSAALRILTEVDLFNRTWTAAGHPPVRVRIGIESGQALVGDLGTSFRSTYTAVGDCINFASRLEAAARDLPTDLVIGAVANRRLERYATYSLGVITLRGTQTAIEVFSVPRPDVPGQGPTAA